MARPGKGAKVGVAIGAIAAVIVVVLAALMISVAVRESALLGAVETKTGSCPEYVWSAEDEYAPDDYPSIVTDDGSLRILQLTDIHFRNQGTFGGKKIDAGQRRKGRLAIYGKFEHMRHGHRRGSRRRTHDQTRAGKLRLGKGRRRAHGRVRGGMI